MPLDPTSREALADECADVFLYLLLVADKAGLDLKQAVLDKLEKNAKKYPVALCKWSRAKYTEWKGK